MYVAWGSVLSRARTSYVGIGMGCDLGRRKTCGQIPTHRQAKQILGGGVDITGIGLLYSWKSLSLTHWGGILPAGRGFWPTWPFPLFTFLLHVYTPSQSTLRSGNAVILCDQQTSAPWCCVAFQFQGIGSLQFHVGGVGGRPFGQVAIFLLFQEFSKAFEPSPVKITWSEDCPPSSFLE